MTYVDEYALFSDTTNALHKKVARAIDKAARDVQNESAETANHAERYVWACTVRVNPETIIAEAHKWILAILDNATVAAAGNEATDNDVQFVVNGLVDTMAGA
jgi:hypothetical protein